MLEDEYNWVVIYIDLSPGVNNFKLEEQNAPLLLIFEVTIFFYIINIFKKPHNDLNIYLVFLSINFTLFHVATINDRRIVTVDHLKVAQTGAWSILCENTNFQFNENRFVFTKFILIKKL